MRKLLLLALLVNLVQKSIIAQTSLTTAVDFTVTDVHGNTHNLFTYLDDGTEIGRFTNSSSDFVIKSSVSDKDMIFKGNDGGSTITALTLDI